MRERTAHKGSVTMSDLEHSIHWTDICAGGRLCVDGRWDLPSMHPSCCKELGQ